MKQHKSKCRRPNLCDAQKYRKQGLFSSTDVGGPVSIDDRKEKVRNLRNDFLKKIKANIPRSKNLELVILKCHLILEYAFEEFIDLMAPVEGVIKSERFNFKQKETLVYMLGFPPDPIFFPSIDLINKLRNQIAHNLEFERNVIDDLIRINTDYTNAEIMALKDTDRATTIKKITAMLCGEIIGVIKVHHEIFFFNE